MKEWYSKWRAHVSTFVREYGKVFLTLTSLLLFGVMLTLLVLQTTQKGLRVTFFDVGQGDAIFVETPSGHDMLIDGGASNLVVSRLASRLSYFDKHLDVVVATHPDSDHITGLIPVFDRYDVGHVVVLPVKGHTDVSEELVRMSMQMFMLVMLETLSILAMGLSHTFAIPVTTFMAMRKIRIMPLSLWC